MLWRCRGNSRVPVQTTICGLRALIYINRASAVIRASMLLMPARGRITHSFRLGGGEIMLL